MAMPMTNNYDAYQAHVQLSARDPILAIFWGRASECVINPSYGFFRCISDECRIASSCEPARGEEQVR